MYTLRTTHQSTIIAYVPSITGHHLVEVTASTLPSLGSDIVWPSIKGGEWIEWIKKPRLNSSIKWILWINRRYMKIGEDRWKDGSIENEQKKMMASKAVRGCHQAPEKWVTGWTSMNIRFLSWMIFPVNETSISFGDQPQVGKSTSATLGCGTNCSASAECTCCTQSLASTASTYGVASKSWFSGTSDLFRLIWSGDIFQSKQASDVMYQSKPLMTTAEASWTLGPHANRSTLVAHFRNVCNQGSCTAQHNSLCWTHS